MLMDPIPPSLPMEHQHHHHHNNHGHLADLSGHELLNGNADNLLDLEDQHRVSDPQVKIIFQIKEEVCHFGSPEMRELHLHFFCTIAQLLCCLRQRGSVFKAKFTLLLTELQRCLLMCELVASCLRWGR